MQLRGKNSPVGFDPNRKAVRGDLDALFKEMEERDE